MAKKPTYEELIIRVKELEKEALGLRKVERGLRIFKTAVESSINAIGITDLEGKLIYVNDSSVKMWGYNNKDEILGRFLPEFWEGDDFLKTVKELREKGVASGEDVGKRKDGSLFYVQFTASMFKDEAGNPSFMFGSFFDITERKHVERALQGSQERFKQLSEASFEAIAYHKDGILRKANEQYFNMFGYDPDELIGKNAMPLTVAPESIELMKKQVSSGSKETYEAVGLRENGTKFPMEIRVREAAYQGDTVRVAIIRDMSISKKIEMALRESEEKYRHLSEGTSEAIVWHDKGIIIEANEQYYEMFGYKPEELVGKNAISLTATPDSIKFIREQISLDHLGPYEIVGKKKDGTMFPMETRVKIMKYKGKIARMGAIRDLTDREKMEEALRDSEERFRMLFEDSPISLWEEDFSDVKKYIDSLRNSGLKDFRAYFENHPEDVDHCLQMVKILAVNRSTLDMYQAENNEEFLSNLEKVFTKESYDLFREELIAIAEGRKTFESEGITQTLKGERKHISLRWSVAPGHEETLSRILVSIIDITDRKRSEESLQKAHDELEQRVEERTKDLEIKTTRLEELNAAMKVLLEHSEMYKKELEEKVLSNIKELVDPYLEKLEGGTSDIRKIYLSIIRSNIDEIISPFTRKLSSKYLNLTPSEIRIANLVKQGKTSKEIAGILNVSGKTVGFHRESIRKKLGLKNQKANLRSHLLSLQ